MLDCVDFVGGATNLEACDAWHPFRAGPEPGEPVQCDIPTPVFTGEFDPSTHRSYGPPAAVGFLGDRWPAP